MGDVNMVLEGGEEGVVLGESWCECRGGERRVEFTEEGVDGAAKTTFRVEEGEEVDAGEGMMVLTYKSVLD